MENATAQSWFLRKQEDNSIFGPLSFEQLADWARNAQVAPHDSISTDQANWMKAPMLPELGMDWLVEVTSERYYGPTTLGAVQEFIRLREIDGETFVINACDGTRRQVRDFSQLQLLAPEEETAEPESAEATEIPAENPNEPAASGISIEMQDRIRDLEQTLREERRAFEEAESRYQDLQQRHSELEQKLNSLSVESTRVGADHRAARVSPQSSRSPPRKIRSLDLFCSGGL